MYLDLDSQASYSPTGHSQWLVPDRIPLRDSDENPIGKYSPGPK
jgi:hypothetical protein